MRSRSTRSAAAPRSVALCSALVCLAAMPSVVTAQASVGEEADTASGPYVVTIPREEAAATVDGSLDEPVWQRAAVLDDFHQYEPVDSRPAEERTEVRVWYGPDAIWFGIIAHDSQPGSVRATKADRDNIDAEDHVIVYLDTFDDRRRAFFFGSNPLGVQMDGVRTEGSASAGHIFGGNIDLSPDYWFDTAGRLTDEGYVVEMRIPFKSLRFPGDGPQEWGLQVVRIVQRTGHTDTWTDVRRANASFLLQSGTITGLHDLHRGVVFEGQPFVTATSSGLRADRDAPFERGSLHSDAGANFRVGFTSLSLDGTINPDFSQVEADVTQVSVNERFALFFPEKRPFFLEGIELFSTPNQLVYTRRIAEPAAGAKLTGKVGPLGVAYLSALDDAPDSKALFNVVRLRTDFGSNSVAGVLFTDRSEQGSSAFNRVAAADTRIVFGKLYYFEAQLGGSWTRQPLDVSGAPAAGDPMMSTAAPLWRASVDRTGRSFGFNYQLNGIGRGFESDAGYVPRSDIVQAHGFNRFTWYGEPGGRVENVTTFFGPTRIWRYAGFGSKAAIEGGESTTTTVRLRGGWEGEVSLERNFVRLFADDYAAYAPEASPSTEFLPLERVSGLAGHVRISTPTYQTFSATAQINRGHVAIFDEGGEGTASTLTGSVYLRPTPWARAALTGTLQRITRERDGSRFALTRLPRLKVEVQPNRALFFRAVAEWRSERRDALLDPRTGEALLVAGVPVPSASSEGLRLDLLASYEPVPGTVAFLGYGTGLVGDSFLRVGDLYRASDGLFVKLAYQFRR